MAMDQNYNQFAVSDLLKSPGDVLKQSIPEATPYQLPISSPRNITFPSGYGVKQTESPIASAMEKFYNSTPSERFQATPIKYNAADINAALYMSSPDYYKLGISLYGDNEERYGQNQSWGEVLSNGITGMGKLAYNGFVDGWKGWSRMTDALVHWDWNKLHGDAESMMELDNSLKDIMNLNPIYATKEGSDTFWNRQTFGNFLQQSGFAVGAAAQMFSEQIITKAIEAGLAVTGVGVGAAAELEVVEDVKTAANIGRVARFFQKTKEFYDAAKNFKALKKLGDVWKNEAILKNFVVGLGEKIPGIDIAMDMSKTYEIGKLAGLSGTKIASDIARVGVGGLKRTMSEANFAFTEARMEAAGTFTDLYNQLQDDYYKKNGQFAKGNDLQFMQNTAMQAADKNFNFNSAVLAVSNRIMFDNIFKNSKATSKILSQFGEDVGEKGLKVLGEIEGRTTTQYYTGGILSNYKQIAADFGASKARKVLARSIMKPLLKFETTEGIQELLQEGSNEYFKDYYLDAYNSKFNPDIKASAEKSFGKAVESQLNMQGLKTFASGALTGMLLHGPTVLIEKGVGKIKEKTEDVYKTQGYTKEQKEEYYKQKKESKDELKNYYNEFNAIAKDPSKLFSESIKNFNIQKEGSSALDEAAKLGDKFAYENIRTDMLHSMVSQAVRNNTHEALIDTLREYGKNMSKEEFEQAFVGINYSSETKKSAQDYTDKVANAIELYAKTYNKLQDKYGSIANPNRYIRGSEQYMKELFKKKTLNDMIDIMAGNEFKAADALDRSSRIFSTLTGHKTLGSSLASAFNILGSDDALQGELNTLELEISTKKEQLQAEGISKQQKEQLKKEIALKEKQHKNITKWSENKLNITNKSKIAKAQSSFKTYLQLKNEEFGKPTLINDSEVDDMFYAFNDYIKLNKKAQDHVNAINMLSNPDYFDQVYMRMVQGQQMAYLQNLTNAAIDYIKSDKYKADEHFIVQANGKYGIFTSTGMLVKMADNLEEARKIKEELDKTPKYTEDEISELFKDLEVKPKEPTEETPKESTEEPEVKPEEKPKTEIKKEQPKVFVNGKSIIFTTQEVKDGKPIFSYYFEDDASKEIQQFTKENDKFIDLETGEEITVTKETPKETVKEPTEKSIDEKIAEIQAKIDALPNKGMVMEGEMITTSKEFKDLNKQIEDLKKQKETEKAKIKTIEDIKKYFFDKAPGLFGNRLVDALRMTDWSIVSNTLAKDATDKELLMLDILNSKADISTLTETTSTSLISDKKADIEAKNTISNGDKIISVQTKPVTDEITDTAEDLFILPDKNPEGRIHINMEPLKDILVVPNNTLTVIDKRTGKEVVGKELNPEGAVIFEAIQGRLFVVANINGQLVPFYKSSAGTSGKTQGAWYPFFGYTGAWLVKGGIDKATGKMSYSPEIDRVTTLLNENLVFPDKYIDRATNSIKNTKGEVIIDMNQAFKVNRLWQKEFGSQTGKGTNYQIKGLKENTRSESGIVALITGLNTTELDSSKTPKELSEWFNLISKNAEIDDLEGKKESESSLGFENLGKLGNLGLSIMENDLLKNGSYIINTQGATPEQIAKIKDDIQILKNKYETDYNISASEGRTSKGSMIRITLDKKGVEDIDQTFDDKKVIIDGDSKEFEKIFQEGIKQTAPALSVANRTHAVNVVEISPGIERFERGDVNQTYEFEMATPTFMPGQSIIFKVDEFDGKDYDNANIGIYSVLNGKETRIGAVHTPQWISEQKGSNNAYTHIVIPDSEKYDKLPKTLENELATNRKLRKVILDSYKLDSNFVLNGTVNDKSNGIIATMNEAGLLKDRINPEIGKGGVENRHGMFGIVRNGYIELSRGQKISEDKLAQTKSFSSSEIANYEGYSVLLIPTPNGTFFPTFMKLPTVAREQSEFILKAWKVFTGRESGDDLINAVYNATGNTYVEGSKPNIEILKSYISHYITDLNSDSLSQIGNGNDAPDNISRLDIFQDGNIKIQGKKNGKWMSVTIRKEQDIPSDILEYMDGLLTSVRFTNIKNDNLIGINNEDKFTLFGVKDGKLTSNNITYNQYIMNGAKTYLDKGIESKNEYKDWVYFANPVVKFQYSEPSKDLFKDVVENKKPEVTLTEVTDETKKDKASSLLAALKANRLNNQQVKDQENNCSGN